MTASTMPASTESATGPDRDRSQRDPVGGSVRGPGAGTARIDSPTRYGLYVAVRTIGIVPHLAKTTRGRRGADSAASVLQFDP